MASHSYILRSNALLLSLNDARIVLFHQKISHKTFAPPPPWETRRSIIEMKSEFTHKRNMTSQRQMVGLSTRTGKCKIEKQSSMQRSSPHVTQSNFLAFIFNRKYPSSLFTPVLHSLHTCKKKIFVLLDSLASHLTLFQYATYHDVSLGERDVIQDRVEHLRHLRVHLADQRPLIFSVLVLHLPARDHGAWRPNTAGLVQSFFMFNGFYIRMPRNSRVRAYRNILCHIKKGFRNEETMKERSEQSWFEHVCPVTTRRGFCTVLHS